MRYAVEERTLLEIETADGHRCRRFLRRKPRLRRCLMGRKWFVGSIGVVGAMFLASYALFALSAKRPLSLSESLIFSSALLRATPSSLAGGNWIEAVGLARQALASPVSRDSRVVARHSYDVPLPPHSVRYPKRDSLRDSFASHAYITFATREQLDAYYSTTLPASGWEYIEQMGAGRFFRKNTTALVITQSYHLGTKISQFTVTIDQK